MVKLTPRELSQKYDRFARWYDSVEGILELLGISRLRRRVLQHASGRILEVAVGTGKNLPYYPRESRITGLDLSRGMLNIAQKRAAKLSMNVSFLLGDSELLPFPGNVFDTVVSSLSTCTFPDPAAALKEMARVCRPGGKILCSSMAGATASGLDVSKTAQRIDTRNNSAAIGTESHWTL